MDTKASFFRRKSDAESVNSDNQESFNGQDERPERPERPKHPERPERREPSSPREPREKQFVVRPDFQVERPARAPLSEGSSQRRSDDRRPVKGKKIVEQEPHEAPENVIFGVHPVREAIEAERPIEKIYLRRTQQGDRGGESLMQIETIANQANIIVQFVPVEKLDRLSRRNNHQGVVAVVAAIEYAQITDVLDAQPTLLLVLDGVTDVRNFGAIARSAECAGVEAIIIGAKSSAPINGEAMKSSAGALSRIRVCRVGSLRNTLKTIQLAGIQLVAATEKSADTIYSTDLTKPTAIIMGSEERGIGSDTLKICDVLASIPLSGTIESLNVSAAAAVMLFEATRQRSS